MRNFSKKLAFVLAAAMVFTAFAPAAKAKAASEMTINRASQTLYVNEGANDKGSETLADGLYGNVQEYDFYVKNKPSDYAKTLKFVWTSSDEKVATVDQKGLTKAVGVGTATITCTITEKATGNKLVAAPTTKVTVKANASEITLTNAEDFEDQAFKANSEIKFEYKMVAKDGGKATDKVKWIAEPATGVTVKDGVFTFGEDALPGEYTLYAETYQSDKYTATTATSNKVTVTYVADNNIEIKQNNATQFTVKFDNAVKAFSVDDVEMIKRIEVTAGTFDYVQPVKAVELAKDGLSAKVTLYNPLTHNSKYIISVNGYEDYELTASLGKPVRIELYAKDATGDVIVTTGKAAILDVRFYDEKDVEVTVTNPNVIYRLEVRATDGSYFLGGSSLTIKKEATPVKVNAEYTARSEDGKSVIKLTDDETFAAVDAQPTRVGKITDATINGKFHDPTLTMRPGQSGKVQVQLKFATSDGKGSGEVTIGSEFKCGETTYKATLTAATPQYAVATSNGYLTAFKDNVVAEFYVNVQEKTQKGWSDPTPVDFLYITVEPDAKFSHTELSTDTLTVGTKAGFATGKLTLTAKDTYGQDIELTNDDLAKISFKCANDNYNETAFDSAFSTAIVNKKAEITVNASALNSVLEDKDDAPAEGKSYTLYFTATYDLGYTKYSVDFNVLVQAPTEDTANDYIVINPSTDNIDALRIKEGNPGNAKDTKDIYFDVFWMDNGVQVGKLIPTDLEEAKKADAVTVDAYYFKVTKDDKAVKTSQSENKITVVLSSYKKDNNEQNIVDYVGEGAYVFELYKGEKNATTGKAEAVPVDNSFINVYVSDAGEYVVAGEQFSTSVEVAKAALEGENVKIADEKLLLCFNINDRKGNPIVKDGKVVTGNAKIFDNYIATQTVVADAGYVYVEKITFYEKVGTEDEKAIYVPYVVNVDAVLNIVVK